MRAAPLCPAAELIERIPSHLTSVLARLEEERSRSPLWAILFDLGDTLMIEESEEKDETGTTLRAELYDGAADLIRALRRQGYLLGLVADTRPGTCWNVLRQHGLDGAFDVCAISEELGCEKPDRRIFAYALHALGIASDEAGRVAMVGNNLARDVRGANAAGLVSIWLRHNHRFPTTPAGDLEHPRFAVSSFGQLADLISHLASSPAPGRAAPADENIGMGRRAVPLRPIPDTHTSERPGRRLLSEPAQPAMPRSSWSSRRPADRRRRQTA